MNIAWFEEQTFGITNILLFLHIIPAILFFISPFFLWVIGKKPFLLINNLDLYDKTGLFSIHFVLSIIIGISGSGIVPFVIGVSILWRVYKILKFVFLKLFT